jgi:5,10-methylenetetrahydromethanopterin reductase
MGRKLPRFSIRLHGGMTPAACVAAAEAAEQAGLDGIWFAENAFGRGILPAAAACAMATRRLRIGAGVFNPFSRHPTMMAMEIGALDEVSGGRASIGIGAGIGSSVAKIGHSAEKPLAALRDTLTIVRALLNGDTVNYEGQVFSARNVKLDYAPRPSIPVCLAGRGDLTVKLCGATADGLIVSNMCAAEFSMRAANLLEASRLEARRPAPVEIIQYMPCLVDADRGQAVEAAKRVIGAMLPNYWSLARNNEFARMGLLMGTGIDESEFTAAADRLGAGEDAARVLDERFPAAFAIAGTPDDCIEAASRFAEAGVTELALTFDAADPAMTMRLLNEAIERWART